MGIKLRNFEMPKKIWCDEKTYTGTYGRFIAEPFERGFGTTVGNSLRRVLLSSLEGSSVTGVKIKGVDHEFSVQPFEGRDMAVPVTGQEMDRHRRHLRHTHLFVGGNHLLDLGNQTGGIGDVGRRRQEKLRRYRLAFPCQPGREGVVPNGTVEHEQYLQWLHYAEGSAMLPLMLRMYTGRLPDGGAALQPRINDELNRHLGYLDRSLQGVDWFVGNSFSGADIQLSFVAELAPLLHPEGSFPNLAAMRERCQTRPAYKRALKKGGRYDFGPADQ